MKTAVEILKECTSNSGCFVENTLKAMEMYAAQFANKSNISGNDFLKENGMIAENCTEFKIRFEDGRVIDLGYLLEAYGVSSDLTFAELRKANIKRLPQFKNSKGFFAHREPDGSDWTPLEWIGAVAGEVGEAANILKKVKRGDLTMEEALPEIRKELADIQTYLDITAYQMRIDLGEATRDKFNEVSNCVTT